MGLLDKIFGKKPKPPEAEAAAEAAARRESDSQAETLEEAWEQQGTPQELQAAEVRAQLAGPNPPVMLDVREPNERQAFGFIPGSVSIPMSEFPERWRELDATRPVVVYCASGMRSFDAGFFLIEQGFKDVSNLNGGMQAWDGEVGR